MRMFAEPLVPVGQMPAAAENSDLAAALLGYAKRSDPDDFSSLTGFIDRHPDSSWNAALLTDLGLEYYNTAHYSLAINAWSNAWALAKNVTDARGAALEGRAFGELLKMNARLGRMEQLESLLDSVQSHLLPGPAGECVSQAREALWNMQNRPEISFRCGPLALRSIRMALNLPGSNDVEILKSASTQRGCSLPQVAELSKKIGLDYQMAFRESGDFVVPSVVHWKVGHYAAILRKVGDIYELRDPTFGTTTWATRAALDAETSGYFLIPGGPLPAGWRAVDENEGAAVWGKGMTGGNDTQHIAKNDLQTFGFCPASDVGMPIVRAHLMDVNLNLTDTPLSYSPPVGPPARFTFRYNQRDVFQPGNFNFGNLSALWTSDWFTYITDNPNNALADVNLYVGGGGQRTYIGFDTNTQSFAYQQYDRNLLTRTGPGSYQLLNGDGSKLIFGQSDGSVGSSRNIFITQLIDPQGNALTFNYDTNLCLTSVADSIGQVTTLSYGVAAANIGSGNAATTVPASPYLLTNVTDPFGRSASFTYRPLPQTITAMVITIGGATTTNYFTNYIWGLGSATDQIGITSQFQYESIPTVITPQLSTVLNYVIAMTTPYGTSQFTPVDNGNTRSLDIAYPDGSHERVVYDQGNTNQPTSDPAGSLPAGMTTTDNFLQFRDTYYWDRTASAMAGGDYSKARIYHWLHTENLALTSGALESIKPALEGRTWFDYPGQSLSVAITSNTLPAHVGIVLDDGTTRLYTYAYNSFGHVTNSIDPVGRTMSFVYDTNGIDLLEVRQTRAGNNELIGKFTFNGHHRLLTLTDAAGQTTTLTYNSRGQPLTFSDPLGHTTTSTYDASGYLLSMDGPLPGTIDTAGFTYDATGRIRTAADVSGFTLTFDYDNLDRVTRVTYPDSTSSQFSYTLLDCSSIQDRDGQVTTFEHDNVRRLTKTTDPLGRTTFYDWCRCGDPRSIIDPMGRTTTWTTDVEGRTIFKNFADGSSVKYAYENTTSRLAERTDENQLGAFYIYNLDNSIQTISFANAAVRTPTVSFVYDPFYLRPVSMTDGIGTTIYNYNPVTSTPALGAGKLAGTVGPLTNEAAACVYDGLGRIVRETNDGAVTAMTFDAAGRVTGVSNELGAISYSYDGSSGRMVSETYPNGQATAVSYGSLLQDFTLQQINNTAGVTPLSLFNYTHNVPKRNRITAWSQQAGSQAPSLFTLGYDEADQLLSALVTNSGAQVNAFVYSYDAAGNRLTELANGSTATSSFNALNQLSATANAAFNARTNEWDSLDRLTAVNSGNTRTEFGYDGLSRLAYIRELQNGSETSFRRFVWRGNRIDEERDKTGAIVNKRFFPEGVKLETGANTGAYYYTRDHLTSIREMTDAGGNVRARYSYDPYGRRTRLSGDLDADFGFAGMFFSSEANLSLTRFRAYDADLGRWLSRDPLRRAETSQGPNLYAYVRNNPANLVDPLGEAPGSVITTSAENSSAPFGQGGSYGPSSSGAAGEEEFLTLEPDVLTLQTESDAVIDQVISSSMQSAVGGASPFAGGGTSLAQAAEAAEAAAAAGTGGGAAGAGFLGTGCAVGTVAAAATFALAVGVADGMAIDYRLDISGFSSDEGVAAENWLEEHYGPPPEDDSYVSRALSPGMAVTLELATDPGVWIGKWILGD